MLGAKDNPMLGPQDDGVVELEPRHAEDDWVVTETSNIELNGFRVWANLELDRQSFVGKRTGRDGTSVDDFKFSGHGFGSKWDAMASDKLGIDE
jgi:hypothetical protein